MNTPTEEELAAIEQRKLWDALHRYAAVYEGDADAARGWLQEWESRFPPNCPCLEEWREAIGICPPPLEEGRMIFFWWTIALHDRINVLLNKEIWMERSASHILLISLVEDPEHGALYGQRIKQEARHKL